MLLQTVKDLKRHIDRAGSADLCLVNNHDEAYVGGPVKSVTRIGDKVKFIWSIVPRSTAYPFTHIVLREDGEAVFAREVFPITLNNTKSLEVVFDYNA